jgi:hypothetical protein
MNKRNEANVGQTSRLVLKNETNPNMPKTVIPNPLYGVRNLLEWLPQASLILIFTLCFLI